MAPQGMVHALHAIPELLQPGGLLTDIHPTDEPAELHWLGRRAGGDFLGFLEETDGYEEYRQADQAVTQVVASRLYHLQSSAVFWFDIHAQDLIILDDYLRQEWRDARLPAEAWHRLETLQKDAQAGSSHGKILLRERVRLNILAPARQPTD